MNEFWIEVTEYVVTIAGTAILMLVFMYVSSIILWEICDFQGKRTIKRRRLHYHRKKMRLLMNGGMLRSSNENRCVSQNENGDTQNDLCVIKYTQRK